MLENSEKLRGAIILENKLILKTLFIPIMTIIFGLGGCSSEKQKTGYNSFPEQCKIDADKLIITLKENPTTGYSWKFTMDKEGILELESDKYKSDDNPGNLVGVGGKRSWVFKGVSKGSSVITFKYFRPWEDINTAAESRSFTVDVGENGKIEGVR